MGVTRPVEYRPDPPLCAAPVAPVAVRKLARLVARSLAACAFPHHSTVARGDRSLRVFGRSPHHERPIPRTPAFAAGDRRHQRSRQHAPTTPTPASALSRTPTALQASALVSLTTRAPLGRSRDRHSTGSLSAPPASHRARQPRRRFSAFHTARRFTPCGSRRGSVLTLQQPHSTTVESVPDRRRSPPVAPDGRDTPSSRIIVPHTVVRAQEVAPLGTVVVSVLDQVSRAVISNRVVSSTRSMRLRSVISNNESKRRLR